MNWREYPHLFANGWFWFITDKLDQYWMEKGFYYDEDGIRFTEKGYQPDSKVLPFEDCQLVARPIADMSDEELIEAFSDYDFDYKLTSVKWNEEGYFTIKTGGVNPSFIQFLYPNKFRFQLVLNLLDKGVYPFEDNTDVIWRHTLKD